MRVELGTFLGTVEELIGMMSFRSECIGLLRIAVDSWIDPHCAGPCWPASARNTVYKSRVDAGTGESP
jgi:hypothetical protein